MELKNHMLNYRQQKWFKQATEIEQKAFLLFGKPTAAQNLDGSYNAFLNNVCINHISYPSEEKAINAAKKYIQTLTKEKLPRINFEQLGVTNSNFQLAEDLAYKIIFNIHEIIHLATQTKYSSPALIEFLKLPVIELQEVFQDSVEEDGLKELKAEAWPNLFHNWMYTFDVFGFLVKAVAPEPKELKYSWRGSPRYTWDKEQIKWFYGETYQLAFDKAYSWATSIWQ